MAKPSGVTRSRKRSDHSRSFRAGYDRCTNKGSEATGGSMETCRKSPLMRFRETQAPRSELRHTVLREQITFGGDHIRNPVFALDVHTSADGVDDVSDPFFGSFLLRRASTGLSKSRQIPHATGSLAVVCCVGQNGAANLRCLRWPIGQAAAGQLRLARSSEALHAPIAATAYSCSREMRRPSG